MQLKLPSHRVQLLLQFHTNRIVTSRLSSASLSFLSMSPWDSGLSFVGEPATCGGAASLLAGFKITSNAIPPVFSVVPSILLQKKNNNITVSLTVLCRVANHLEFFRAVQNLLMLSSTCCLRRLLSISHLQHVANTKVLRRTNQTQLSTVLCDRRLRCQVRHK